MVFKKKERKKSNNEVMLLPMIMERKKRKKLRPFQVVSHPPTPYSKKELNHSQFFNFMTHNTEAHSNGVTRLACMSIVS